VKRYNRRLTVPFNSFAWTLAGPGHRILSWIALNASIVVANPSCQLRRKRWFMHEQGRAKC